MLVAKVTNTKEFMSNLLKNNTFDDFQVRELSITTFVSFDIHGLINKSFYDEAEIPQRDFSLWSELKPFAFEIIKGNKLPKSIKIVFSAGEELINSINNKASAMFINITFENNEVTLISGMSLKSFSLDKSAEFMWDEWISKFFKENRISLSEPEYEEE